MEMNLALTRAQGLRSDRTKEIKRVCPMVERKVKVRAFRMVKVRAFV
jgi:hypothetical protein